MRSQPTSSLVLLALAYLLVIIEGSESNETGFHITTRDWSNIQDDVPFEIACNASNPDQSFKYTLDFRLYATWSSLASAVSIDYWTIRSQRINTWVPSLAKITTLVENLGLPSAYLLIPPDKFQFEIVWMSGTQTGVDYSPNFTIATKKKATETATSTSTSTSKPAETANSTPQSTPKPEATSTPNSTGQITSSKIGMGIGVGIGGALVLSVAGWFIYRRGRKAALQELTKNTADHDGDAMWTGKPKLGGKGKDPNSAESKASKPHMSTNLCELEGSAVPVEMNGDWLPGELHVESRMSIHDEAKGKEDLECHESVKGLANAQVGNTPNGSSRPELTEREDMKTEIC